MLCFNIHKTLEILKQTPDTLYSFIHDLSDEWIFTNEGDNTWSPFDIIGHLIHGEKTDWIPRLKHILSNNNTPFESFDRFAQFENSKGKSLLELLEKFKDLRNKNVAYLASLNLSESDLVKKGIHPELGEVTAKELLATWVVHDLGHIAQIARVMAKQYKEEVGVWSAYLPILNK